MFPKSLKKILHALRPVLLTTPVPKSGKINLMESRVISGHLAVCFMKCALWDHHLLPLIFKDFTEKYAQEFLKEFLCAIQINWPQPFHPYSKLILKKGRQSIKFSPIQSFKKDTKAKSTWKPKKNAMNFCKHSSTILKISKASKKYCQNPITMMKLNNKRNLKSKTWGMELPVAKTIVKSRLWSRKKWENPFKQTKENWKSSLKENAESRSKKDLEN